MQIITPESADKIIKRKPWPIYSTFPHCSGPCEQGHRLCTTPEACQTGMRESDDMPREPMTALDKVLVVAAFGTAALVVALAANGALPYVLALGRWIAGALS